MFGQTLAGCAHEVQDDSVLGWRREPSGRFFEPNEAHGQRRLSVVDVCGSIPREWGF